MAEIVSKSVDYKIRITTLKGFIELTENVKLVYSCNDSP